MARRPDPRRTVALRLVLAILVIGGAYVGLAAWSASRLPSDVRVAGVPVGGMTDDDAVRAIERGTASLLTTPISLRVPGTDETFAVRPDRAGLSVDARRSIEGLTSVSLNPLTLWHRLTGSVEAPLVTHIDDDALTARLTEVAAEVARAPTEGTVGFPEGRVTIDLPVPGRELDLPGTELALRRAFAQSRTATAVVTRLPPRIAAEQVQAAADGFGRTAMSGPVTLVAGKSRASLAPADFAPAVTMVPDEEGGLEPRFDEELLGKLVADRVKVATKAPVSARWVFGAGNGAPRLVPSTDGTAVDSARIPGDVAAAISSDTRTVTIRTVVTKPALTTAAAQQAGVKELIVDFRSPFPPEDTTRTHNLVVATRTINGTYVPPGGTFSLNGILGERTTAKGYGDGTVIINGRLTRGTGGGISQVSTTIYNMAYFAGVDIQEFTPHAFFIPRYPEGREATVYWPTVDNKWRNDTPHGMLLQTWVQGGYVHGRVWSTKTWDIRSVKGPRRNVVQPRTIRDDSARCYPQQPQPGFDVTVTRQWYRPGSSTLVKSEPVHTHYIPEHRIICTNPDARP